MAQIPGTNQIMISIVVERGNRIRMAKFLSISRVDEHASLLLALLQTVANVDNGSRLHQHEQRDTDNAQESPSVVSSVGVNSLAIPPHQTHLRQLLALHEIAMGGAGLASRHSTRAQGTRGKRSECNQFYMRSRFI